MICAENVFLANDLEVVGDIRCRRDEGEKAGDKGGAADRVEDVSVAQNLRESDQVDALARHSKARPERCKSSGAPECRSSLR